MSDPVSTGDNGIGHKPVAGEQGDAGDKATQFTRCPYCQAVFRVGRNKLDVRQGEVRCGACREVFNALSYQVIRNEQGLFEPVETDIGTPDHASEQPLASEPPNDGEDARENQSPPFQDSPTQDTDTPESDTLYPGSAMEDLDVENQDSVEPGFQGSDEDEEDEATRRAPVFTDTEAPAKPAGYASGTEQQDSGKRQEPRLDDVEDVEDYEQTDDDPAEDHVEPESADNGTTRQSWFSVEPDPLLDNNPFAVKRDRDREEKGGSEGTAPATQAPSGQFSVHGVDEYIKDRTNPLVTVFWTLVAVGFVFLLGFQVKYYFVDRFAGDQRYRPYLSGFCRIAGCELPPRTDSYRFTITNTRIDLHPSEPGALRITVKLLNQAKFSQPFPILELTLTDRLGRVVGRRSFDPSLYLDSEQTDLLDSGELETVMFDLAHPHEKAVGFVVDVVRSPNNV